MLFGLSFKYWHRKKNKSVPTILVTGFSLVMTRQWEEPTFSVLSGTQKQSFSFSAYGCFLSPRAKGESFTPIYAALNLLLMKTLLNFFNSSCYIQLRTRELQHILQNVILPILSFLLSTMKTQREASLLVGYKHLPAISYFRRWLKGAIALP